MKRRIAASFAFVLGLGVAAAWAADPQPAPEEPAAPAAPAAPEAAPEQPFGWQMMTTEERAAHCSAMRSAKTPEEREQLRAQHHALMVARAKQRGMTLPAQPMMGPGAGCRGLGMGPGMMGGRGMGGPGMMGNPPPAPPAPPAEPAPKP